MADAIRAPRQAKDSRGGGIGRGLGVAFAERPARQVIALAAALFALVFAIRTLDDTPAQGLHLFYIIPVILLALRFGPRGGIAGAVVALVLFAGWTLFNDKSIDYATWASPAFTVLIVGALVGSLAQSLTRSEHRFRVAAENLLEPFAVYSAVRDEHGTIIDFRNEFINQAGAESVGLTAEQMVGGLLSELFPGRLEHGLIDVYASVVRTGRPVFREAIDYVNVLGEETLVRAFDIRISKLDDGIEVTWRDITDRVRAERERDWLASIVEHASDAVLSVDRDKRIISWSESAEQLYGYSRAEVIGQSFEFLIDPEDAERRHDYLDRVLDGERPGPIEAVELCKDGSKVRVSFIGWPILGATGDVIGAARIVRRRPA